VEVEEIMRKGNLQRNVLVSLPLNNNFFSVHLLTLNLCSSISNIYISPIHLKRYLFLMSAAMAIKACSTLMAFFALVSMKGIPISSANAF
jgi:hypothetical protein